MSATSPRVYIVLLNWNGWRDTIECLRSVFGLEYSNARVVVCDNGSTDGSLDHIRAWANTTRGSTREIVTADWHPQHRRDDATADLVLLPTGGNLGFAGGNNIGLHYVIERGDADYVWLLNNDTVVAADVLTHMVGRATGDVTIGAVGATLVDFDADVVQEAGAVSSRWTGMSKSLAAGQPLASWRGSAGEVDFITGGCMLVPITTIRRVGVLDDRFFMYCEDVDWCIRMRAAGLRLVLAPEALVRHKAGASTVYKSSRHDYMVAKSTLMLIEKHHPARLPIAFANSVYRLLLPRLVRGHWVRLRAVLRAYAELSREMRTRWRGAGA